MYLIFVFFLVCLFVCFFFIFCSTLKISFKSCICSNVYMHGQFVLYLFHKGDREGIEEFGDISHTQYFLFVI